MKSVYNFVVKPKGKRYNNTKKLDSGELILNTDIYQHKYVNREEKVNTNTLTATFRELILDKGEAVPVDVFSIYQSNKTKIIRS